MSRTRNHHSLDPRHALLIRRPPSPSPSPPSPAKYSAGAGGLYLWARNEPLDPRPGFLNFWVYWLGIAFLIPGAAPSSPSASRVYALADPNYAYSSPTIAIT